MAASYSVRTSTYLKMRLNPKLNELGAVLGGTFTFEDVHAMGMTGIILRHVTFQPNIEGAHPYHFQSVVVYPEVTGMFVGDLNASRIELNQMSASLDLSHDDTVDLIWVKSVLHRIQEDNNNSANAGKISNKLLSLMPQLVFQSCALDVAISANNQVKIEVPVQTVSLESIKNKQIELSREPVKVCYTGRYSREETCLDASVAAVWLDNRIRLSEVNIQNFSSHGLTVNTSSLDGIEFSHNDHRSLIYIDSGLVNGHLDFGESSAFSDLSGDYSVSFKEFEIVHESEANRLGFGVSLMSSEESAARLFGGYAFDQRKVAVTLETSQFDFARFLTHAEFSKWLKFEALPVSGQLETIVDLGKSQAYVDFDVNVANCALTSSALSNAPLSQINGNLAMTAWADMSEKTFTIEHAHGSLGEIPFDFAALRQKNASGGHRFDVLFASAGQSDGFIASLPVGFAPMLTGYSLTGPYGIRLGLSFDDNDYDALMLDAEFMLDEVQTLKYDPRSDFSRLVGDSFMVRVNAASVPISIGPKDPNWARFYDLPRETAYAFVASEDTKFFMHNGFDIRAIRASLIADLKADKVVRGGSTISQQVVKNLFLNHDKTASRKFQEAFLTWQMERTLPKIRIIELYLNLAHWAKDVYGIREAAKYYFNKPISQLTLRESLFLVSILPNPIVFGRQYSKNQLSSSRINKMLTVGTFLRQANRISEAEWEAAVPLIKEGKISDRPRPVIE